MKTEGITQGQWVAHVNYATQSGQADPVHPHWCEVRSENNGPNGYPLSIKGHFGISNAQLIAAAPDLLAALQELTARFNFLSDKETAGAGPIHWREIAANGGINKARAAIAKAEGRA